MSRIQLFSPIDLIFFSSAIFMLFYTSLNYLVFGLKKEKPKNRMLIVGFSCIFFGLAVSRFIHFMMMFQIKGVYINHNYYVDGGETTELFYVLNQFYIISFFLGVIFFYILFEKIFQKTHYILTLVNSLLLFFIILEGYIPILGPFGYYLLISSIVINIITLFYIFIWFTRSSNSEFQSIAGIIMISFLFQLIGILLITETIVELGIIPLTIPAIFFLMSAVISLIPINSGKKIISKSTLIWSILIVILIALFLINISIVGNFQLGSLYQMLIFLLNIGTISLIGFGAHRIYKNLKISENVIEINEKGNAVKNILKEFIKPKKSKEKDIKISKDLKVCVICGKKLKKFSYICPRCSTFYCEKCLNKVSMRQEKKCWVCDFELNMDLHVWGKKK